MHLIANFNDSSFDTACDDCTTT
ncbi:hypothetical protein CP061683_1093A, partial [Chlamydia psittaci 06-1683]